MLLVLKGVCLLHLYAVITAVTDVEAAKDTMRGATDLILEAGYPAEKHRTVTSDGYVLTMHRIPSYRPGAPVALVMHGLQSSASDFLVIGPEKALGFYLHGKGYDVWLGNARGSRFSRTHVRLDPDKDPRYWDFSWHEIGTRDIPAMIDYILDKETGQEKLTYIGHSQGTTAFFVMASTLPEYNAKIKSMHALAPVVYMSHVKSAFFTTIATGMPIVQRVNRQLKIYEQFGYMDSFSVTLRTLCSEDPVLMINLCLNMLFLNGGFDPKQMNMTILPKILEQLPAGASFKQVFHFSQVYRSGKFRQYDYGSTGNMLKYGTPEPPAYDLSKITAPIFLYHGDNDFLADPEDVHKVIPRLRSIEGVYRVPNPEFSHHDFLWAIDVVPLVYEKLVQDMSIHVDQP